MFTFQPIDLLLVLVAGLLLVAGLSLLSLRRRNEILQDFLTPDETGIDVEFLKRKEPVVEQPVEEAEESNETEAEIESTGWGDIADPLPDQSPPLPSTPPEPPDSAPSIPPGPPGPPGPPKSATPDSEP